MPSVSVICCGISPAENEKQDSPALYQAHCASRLQDADAALLNDALQQLTDSAPVIFFADADVLSSAEPLQDWMPLLTETPQTAGLLLMRPPDFPVPPVWEEGSLPEHLQPFLPPVSTVAAAALCREHLSDGALGKFRPVEEPLREWFVRAVLSGQNVICRTIRTAENQSKSQADDPSALTERGTTFLPALRPLRPGTGREWICTAVEEYRPPSDKAAIRSLADVTALRAGLLQMNDFLEESHQFSQSVQGKGRHAAGDYWHGIMHRREPDYSNAKYWFRRVGRHPVFAELAEWAEQRLPAFPEVRSEWKQRLLAGGEWDPFAFIDFCANCSSQEDDEPSRFARQLQWVEMLLLLRQTARDAFGRQ